MKKVLLTAIAVALVLTGCTENKTNDSMEQKLTLTQEWDKVFPKSDKVTHEKVTFKNRFGIELAADLYKPINADGKLPAIACSGPFGAVKEQSSGLYAQAMAERGFLTVAFDPSYTGDLISKESGTTAQRHIQDAVIERSKQLLVETSLPVSEIAYRLGFEYPQHFSRLFKSRTGMTPNEFRLTA